MCEQYQNEVDCPAIEGMGTGIICVILLIWGLFMWLQYWACTVLREGVWRMEYNKGDTCDDDAFVAGKSTA